MASAQAVVPVPARDLYAYLADLERHWDLLPGDVDVVRAGRDGALLRLRGPLGLRRTVRTQITLARPSRELRGRARTRAGSVATVTWSLAPRGAHTHVRLSAHVERATALDRLLLALGGNAWLSRAFGRAIARLAAAAV